MRTSRSMLAYTTFFLLILLLGGTLPVAHAESVFSPTKPPPGGEIVQYTARVRVNVGTATGKLMKNWESFVKGYYRGWHLEQGPAVEVSAQGHAYWYVVLERVSYTVMIGSSFYTLPAVLGAANAVSCKNYAPDSQMFLNLGCRQLN